MIEVASGNVGFYVQIISVDVVIIVDVNLNAIPIVSANVSVVVYVKCFDVHWPTKS